MRGSANIYVCSKPLQYFNVCNLPRSGEHYNILIIENRFKNAGQFYKSVAAHDDSWNEVLFVRNRLQILFLCLFRYRPAHFYYYLDWLLMPALLLYFLPCKYIYIYEEGVGSYRVNIFEKTATFKRKIRRLLQISEYPGFHPKVKGIFLYCKEFYVKRFTPYSCNRELNPLSFDTSFSKMIANNMEKARRIFQFDLRQAFPFINNKRVVLYISSWPFDDSFFKMIDMDDYDYCLIKIHPHIENLDMFKQWSTDQTIIIDSVILSEFLVEQLVVENNKLDIYHCSSTSVLYINEHPNIRAVKNIAQKKGEFDILYAGIHSDCVNKDNHIS